MDDVLCGGLPANRLYLLQGDPGVGKTTASLQFLREGIRRGETALYVSLSETRDELEGVMLSHGWEVAPLHIYQLNVGESPHDPHTDENTIFVPAEVEFGERMDALLAEIDRVKPQRLVIDSCSELRLLAQTQLRFRRHLLALKEKLARRHCTIILIENPLKGGDVLLQSLVHGVIEMQQLAPLYGSEKRRLRILKMREVRFRGGFHDLVMRRGGVVVFPRLVAADHVRAFAPGALSSGLPRLDALLGGGLDRGTSTLFLGPPGSGKSALAVLIATAAAARGERVAMFSFEEGMHTLRVRSAALGMPLEEHMDAGRISVRSVDPAELAPGEFAHAVRHAVAFKAGVVERDETEQGDRALLNLGHTFGHALEAATGYSDRLLHGEAVSIGCQLAFELSAALNLCPPEAPARVARHFAAMGMRHRLCDISGDLPGADALIGLMGQDKKVRDGKLVFVLTRGVGAAFVARDVDLGAVRDVLIAQA